MYNKKKIYIFTFGLTSATYIYIWNDPLKYYAFNFQLRFHLHS